MSFLTSSFMLTFSRLGKSLQQDDVKEEQSTQGTLLGMSPATVAVWQLELDNLMH